MLINSCNHADPVVACAKKTDNGRRLTSSKLTTFLGVDHITVKTRKLIGVCT